MPDLWAFLEMILMMIGGLWLAFLIVLVAFVAWTAFRSRRSAWMSHADLFAFPETHDLIEGSRSDPP